LVKRKLECRDALAASANIVNNPPLSFLHYHIGALHPYFPDLPKGFDYNMLVPRPPEPPKEEQEEEVKYEEVFFDPELQSIEETAEIVETQPEESQPEEG
jgi:hypothetical protein